MRHKQELHKAEDDGFMLVENVSELNSKDKKTLGYIVHEIFTQREQPLNLKKSLQNVDLELLFTNENAITKFLLDAQSGLAETSFMVNLHRTKYEYLSKILKLVITSWVIRYTYWRLSKAC